MGDQIVTEACALGWLPREETTDDDRDQGLDVPFLPVAPLPPVSVPEASAARLTIALHAS